MFEQQSNSQASWTHTFRGSEDDVVDALLSLLRRDQWENLKLHYEHGTLSAERTELRKHTENSETDEYPVTFAIAVSWFESDGDTEVMVEVTETEFDWTQDECSTICESIKTALRYTFPMLNSAPSTSNSEESVD